MSAPQYIGFIPFVFKQHRSLLGIVLIGAVLQFTIFKLLYPFPDFFSDSWSYIFAAYEKMDVNIWPIGYSKFLYLFHGITQSDLALNTFQYFSIMFSALYFYFSIVYFYATGKYTRIILILFLFFNPLFLYVANYVTSDAIFLSLSLVWITQLIWIMQRPKLYQVFLQAFVFFVAFTFRYNAMYYPIIAAGAFLFSVQPLWKKVLGIISGPLLIIPFIFFSLNASEKLTGTAQFPPILGGWQWANNALYMYEYIQVDSNRLSSPEVRELNRISQEFFKTTPPEQRDLLNYVANYFIRQSNAPLKQYMNRHYKYKNYKESVLAWGKVAPVFKEFGLPLVKQHPVAYARHYMLLNTMNYFFPPLEKLEIYNLGNDETIPIVKKWFNYDTLKLRVVSKTLQNSILFTYPTAFFLFNLILLVGYIHFLMPKYFKAASQQFKYCVILIGVFVLLNFGFSIFANIIVIRYQLFPMIICLTFGLLFVDELQYFGKTKD